MYRTSKLVALAAVWTIAMSATLAQATTLTFVGGDAVPTAAFGSAAGTGVSGFDTPAVSLDWTDATPIQWFDWSGVFYGGDGATITAFDGPFASSADIVFDSLGSIFHVKLGSIDNNSHTANAGESMTWRANVDGVDYDTVVTYTGDAGEPFAADFSAVPTGFVITLTALNFTGGSSGGDWDHDNLVFSQFQVLPEPSSVTLLLGCLVMVGSRRRNRIRG